MDVDPKEDEVFVFCFCHVFVMIIRCSGSRVGVKEIVAKT